MNLISSGEVQCISVVYADAYIHNSRWQASRTRRHLDSCPAVCDFSHLSISMRRFLFDELTPAADRSETVTACRERDLGSWGSTIWRLLRGNGDRGTIPDVMTRRKNKFPLREWYPFGFVSEPRAPAGTKTNLYHNELGDPSDLSCMETCMRCCLGRGQQPVLHRVYTANSSDGAGCSYLTYVSSPLAKVDLASVPHAAADCRHHQILIEPVAIAADLPSVVSTRPGQPTKSYSSTDTMSVVDEQHRDNQIGPSTS